MSAAHPLMRWGSVSSCIQKFLRAKRVTLGCVRKKNTKSISSENLNWNQHRFATCWACTRWLGALKLSIFVSNPGPYSCLPLLERHFAFFFFFFSSFLCSIAAGDWMLSLCGADHCEASCVQASLDATLSIITCSHLKWLLNSQQNTAYKANLVMHTKLALLVL